MIAAGSLTPLLGSEARSLLGSPGLLRHWVNECGSPLHVVFPATAAAVAREWLQVASSIYEWCDIRFALKSCKSEAVVKAFSLAGLGADVSSVEELLAALTSYVPPGRISFTGPDKPSHEHLTCLRTGVNIHVDSPGELRRLLEVADWSGEAPQISLRLRTSHCAASRFGMSAADVADCALALRGRRLPLEGIAFHLDGYGIEDRVAAARECLTLMRELAAAGVLCRSLDVGGGFPLRYLNQAPSEAQLDELPRWGAGAVAGSYPYDAMPAGTAAMGDVLRGVTSRPEDHAFLVSNHIAIRMQPGRALLDQVGLSAFRVVGVKAAGNGADLLVLDGMNYSLSETWFGADFLPSPLLVTSETWFESTGADYALAGRSCLESDMIRRTAVGFAEPPECGDLIVFANTAGYQMDSNESQFHRRPLPQKVAAVRSAADGFRYFRDDCYKVEDFRHDDQQHR